MRPSQGIREVLPGEAGVFRILKVLMRQMRSLAKPLDKAQFTDPTRPPERVLFSITTKFPALFQ